MKIRLKIETPKGKASGAERTLRMFLIGKIKQPIDTYVSPEDDVFYWEIETTPKGFISISKRVAMFHALAYGTLGTVEKNKMLHKAAEIYAGKEQTSAEAFRETRSLFDSTNVSIIRTATAEEIHEDGLSFWERVKKKFRRKTE